MSRFKAVIFDLDGTLYRPETLRRAMLLRLLHAHAVRPLRGLRTARVLRAYRNAQEHLRNAAIALIRLAGWQNVAAACRFYAARPKQAIRSVNPGRTE